MKYDMCIVYCPENHDQGKFFELMKNLREQFPLRGDEFDQHANQIVFIVVTKPEAVMPLQAEFPSKDKVQILYIPAKV